MESLNINTQICYTDIGTTMGVFMQDNQKQTQWIYAAAIMDSDGCFMIAKYKRKSGNFYLPCVKIVMIKDGSINYIKNQTGLGRIIKTGIQPSRPNSQPLFQWTITNRPDLIIFLKGIIPYLQNKKDRAEHLLEYCEQREYRHYGTKHERMSDVELNCREQAYLKMRELNGNKVAATTKSPRPEKVCDSLNSMET